MQESTQKLHNDPTLTMTSYESPVEGNLKALIQINSFHLD